MKKRTRVIIAYIGFSIILGSCSPKASPLAALPETDAQPAGSEKIQDAEQSFQPETTNLVQAYAVLAAKDDYSDVGMTDLLVDYIDNTRMREALLSLGWNSENIHELQGFDRDALQSELDWLENTADENDIVLFYVTGHGKYLADNIAWSDFFPLEWSQVASIRRLLIVDACTAAEFTNAAKRDPKPHISIAAVDKDEYGWKGIEEEGLPIIGGVFTYYFSEAISSTEADSNGDGLVSVREATISAEKDQREYMHDVVFAVQQFVDDFHAIGSEPENDPSYPDVIVDDTIVEQLFLDLSAYTN